MAEEKERQQKSTSNGKRSLSSKSTDENDHGDNASPAKRPRIELEQTGYHRGLVPESLMGATDIYDGELMFLYVFQARLVVAHPLESFLFVSE